MNAPTLPPLFTGQDAAGGDPFALACQNAQTGCDAGLVIYNLGADRLRAAIVFAPEVPLSKAAVMRPICGVGFQNALGALAPPEVAVHLGWDGTLYINGGGCGTLKMAATGTAQEVPDWLVVALDLALWPPHADTGLTPAETALYAEGCAGVDALTLLEAWVRHTLVGINTWADSGTATLHREWQGLAHRLQDEITVNGMTGTFIGLDEDLGLLLKCGDETISVPLTDTLTRPA